MYWIKDVDGNPVNLALAEMIVATQRGGWHLYAIFRSGVEATLYVGSAEQVGNRRDDLFRKLLEVQHNAYQID